MKRFLGVMLVVVILAIVMYTTAVIWGNKLPEEHIVSISFKVNANADEVWERITDWNEFPAWRHDLKAIEELPDSLGNHQWYEVSKFGDRQRFMMSEVVKPHRVVIQLLTNNRAYSGRWIVNVFPEKENCTVTIVEEGAIYNPFLRLIAYKILGLQATISGYERSLVQSFQSVQADT